MEWVKHTGMALGALTAAGAVIAMITTFVQCEKVDITQSLWEGFVFGSVPSIVPAVARYLPSVIAPFVNVLRDTFGVSPEKAPILGQGYVMMLLAWIMASRMVTSIHKTVCVPTPDEVAEFKKHFQVKQVEKDADEAKRNETAQRKA